MESLAPDSAPPAVALYHGTRAAAARTILREGFRRAGSRSYTGAGVCLSESLTIAYEYGMYETGGCVLEARLAAHARWADGLDAKAVGGVAWDDLFVRSRLDAVRTFAGNVWIVWTPGALTEVRRLSHRQALWQLCAEFDAEGPECGYNGVVNDYASIWWKQDEADPNLRRFPAHREQLRARLQRFVGRAHSSKA